MCSFLYFAYIITLFLNWPLLVSLVMKWLSVFRLVSNYLPSQPFAIFHLNTYTFFAYFVLFSCYAHMLNFQMDSEFPEKDLAYLHFFPLFYYSCCCCCWVFEWVHIIWISWWENTMYAKPSLSNTGPLGIPNIRFRWHVINITCYIIMTFS